MSAGGREPMVRRAAYALLVVAVRGRRGRGGPWGEAVLGEFAMTRGSWEAVRWAAGGLTAVWLERRARVRQLPRYDRIARRILVAFVPGLIAAVLVSQFVLGARYVSSDGMAPTLQVHDRFLLDRVGFRLTGVHVGDVLVYRGEAGYKFTQRVVGLPGDTVECRDGRVLRNGIPLRQRLAPDGRLPPVEDCAPVVVRRATCTWWVTTGRSRPTRAGAAPSTRTRCWAGW